MENNFYLNLLYRQRAMLSDFLRIEDRRTFAYDYFNLMITKRDLSLFVTADKILRNRKISKYGKFILNSILSEFLPVSSEQEDEFNLTNNLVIQKRGEAKQAQLEYYQCVGKYLIEDSVNNVDGFVE